MVMAASAVTTVTLRAVTAETTVVLRTATAAATVILAMALIEAIRGLTASAVSGAAGHCRLSKDTTVPDITSRRDRPRRSRTRATTTRLQAVPGG